MLHPKKVGTLPIEGKDEAKQTNEIGMFTQVLDGIDIAGKDITADALLTQRKLATYVVARQGHYHFTVKGNQPTLQSDITLLFQDRGAPDHVEVTPPDHGRIETRRIWCSCALNDYLDFPHVGQVFMIEREAFHKKDGKTTFESVVGVTSRPPEQADPKRVLATNRGHWAVESHHYLLDWNFNEDRSRMFFDDDADALGRKSAAVVARVYGVAQRLSGSSEKEVQEIVKNSEGDRDDGSS